MKSIVCKNCLPEEYQHKADQLTGFWDVDRAAGVARCANCGFKRTFVSRKKKTNQMTPSQERQIEAVQEWFKSYFRKAELAKVETELWTEAGGKVHVVVETTDHPLTCNGVSLLIGRRGGIEILFTTGIGDVHDKKFYEKWLK